MKKRNIKLDVIRITSLIFVIGIHFFAYTGFYTEKSTSKIYYSMFILRSLFITCVPMFIILTGYLMNKKELSKKYYKGIIRVLFIYLICSIIYSLFLKYYFKSDMNLFIFIKNLLSYNGTKYSWYIEMYIGLFLLIPFLNIMFNNLKTEKEVKILLITLAFLTGLPSLINILSFSSKTCFISPGKCSDYFQILPSWWSMIYPLFYYFLGSDLKKYEFKISFKLNLILLIVMLIIDSIFNIYRSHNTVFIWGTWNDYCSLSVMIISALLFNLFLKINIKINNKSINIILKTLSDACLGAYLLSCIFDKIFYNLLDKKVIFFNSKVKYIITMIFIIFICSISFSIIINDIYKLILRIFNNKRRGLK